jgi:hypothetical protein
MPGHPQGSNRKLWAAKQLNLGNSTGQISVNSSALIVASQLRIGSKTTYFSSNSTGVRLGGKYIKTNSTGN